MDTVNGNRIIAEFMGAEEETMQVKASPIGNAKAPTGRIYFQNRNPDNMHLCLIEDLRYHTSWDWLMPVIEKIESIEVEAEEFDCFDKNEKDTNRANFGVYIFKRCCDVQPENSIYGHMIEVTAAPSKIEATWQAVIQFINWFNTTHQQIKK